MKLAIACLLIILVISFGCTSVPTENNTNVQTQENNEVPESTETDSTLNNLQEESNDDIPLKHTFKY